MSPSGAFVRNANSFCGGLAAGAVTLITPDRKSAIGDFQPAPQKHSGGKLLLRRVVPRDSRLVPWALQHRQARIFWERRIGCRALAQKEHRPAVGVHQPHEPAPAAQPGAVLIFCIVHHDRIVQSGAPAA
ncbi:MAG TPA: hypothetical protein VKG65_10750 [Terriglobales bacterium]|nr:hypothetical protein [Terriglobales bacterium]